jgi:hypothetical protein
MDIIEFQLGKDRSLRMLGKPKEAYTRPKLTVHGTVEQITLDPKQTGPEDGLSGPPGYPQGKCPGGADQFTGVGHSAPDAICS